MQRLGRSECLLFVDHTFNEIVGDGYVVRGLPANSTGTVPDARVRVIRLIENLEDSYQDTLPKAANSYHSLAETES